MLKKVRLGQEGLKLKTRAFRHSVISKIQLEMYALNKIKRRLKFKNKLFQKTFGVV
jgi:hypothetical protein